MQQHSLKEFLIAKITIRDIAKQSGISTITVSRVLNNSPKVSPEVRSTTLRVIEELGYHPSQAARELKDESSKTIALVITDDTNEHYFQIAQIIIHAVQEEGYTLSICNSFSNSEIERNYPMMFSERKIDGLVLNSCGGSNELIISSSQKIPTVLIHRRIDHPGFIGDFANADFGISTYEMTMELMRNRHTKISIICGSTQFSSAAERLQQLKRAMASIHIMVDRDCRYFLEGPHDSAFGHEASERFLRLPHPPIALVVAHNETCIGILRYYRDHSVPIPKTLSIVAPCNVNLYDLPYVQPTYVLPDTWALGFGIGQMLLERIQSGNQLFDRKAIYIPRIIQGSSISCPGDPQ